jgi:2-phospho-L-lactate guanylyltransferase
MLGGGWDKDMKRAALIPVKRLRRTKTRLGRHLAVVERAGLSITIFSRVVEACREAGIKPVCVSPDPYVESLAKSRGWAFIKDRGSSLRSAISMGVQRLVRDGYDEVMVVSADLPLIGCEDIKWLVRISRQADAVLCPNLHMDGTNIIYLRHPRLFRPLYGGDSYRKHLKHLRSYGLAVKTFITMGTALDIDTPSDLKLLSRLRPSSTSP